MARLKWMRIAALLLCVGFAAFWSQSFHPVGNGGIKMVDLGAYYFSAKCVLHHQDAYDPDLVFRMLQDEDGRFPSDPVLLKQARVAITVGVNLPTTLFLMAPLTFLSWATAQMLWIILTSAMLVLAGYLIWSLADETAPVLSGWLICFILANCEVQLAGGNLAGIVVSFCVVAAWCFLKERFIPVAIVLLAISLCLKPHDTGFVWLYFLLAGGVFRKRALQTLAVVAVIGTLAAIWIAPSSPHWIQELHRNHISTREIGELNDPSPSGETSGGPAMIIDLQAALSVFRNDPHFYDLGSYLIVGSLITIWVFLVLRRRPAREHAWLALAPITVLSLLPVYHRPSDAKLLLLTIPACAILWAQGGARRWLSLALTGAGILITSDTSLALLVSYCRTPGSTSATYGKAVVVSLLVPLVLLVSGAFYLWVQMRYSSNLPSQDEDNAAKTHHEEKHQKLPIALPKPAGMHATVIAASK